MWNWRIIALAVLLTYSRSKKLVFTCSSSEQSINCDQCTGTILTPKPIACAHGRPQPEIHPIFGIHRQSCIRASRKKKYL